MIGPILTQEITRELYISSNIIEYEIYICLRFSIQVTLNPPFDTHPTFVINFACAKKIVGKIVIYHLCSIIYLNKNDIFHTILQQ